MVLGVPDKLQIFLQLYLIELLGLLIGLDMSKAFVKVRHAGLLHKLKSWISGLIFGLISFFLSTRQLRVVLGGKSSQEYPVNAGVPEGSILGSTLFLLYINYLPDNVICNIAIYADDITLYSDIIRSVATTWIAFWTWIWSTRYCALRQENTCPFQCWKNSTGFFNQSNKNGSIYCGKIIF